MNDLTADEATATPITVYRLYGHYSFKSRDGGVPVTIALANGYTIGALFHGTSMIIGPRVAVSVEQAIYHGFARIIPPS